MTEAFENNNNFKNAFSVILGSIESADISDQKKAERDAFKSLTIEEQCRQIVNEANAEKGDLGFPHCPICNDKGHVSMMPTDPDWMIPQSRRCGCMPLRGVYKSSGLSQKLWEDYSFENFITQDDFQKRMKDLAHAYCKTVTTNKAEPQWLCIDGQSGCGKTHLCVSVIKKIAHNFQTIVFMRWMNDADRLKARVNEIDTGKQKYLTAPLLFIDDFLKTNNQLKPTDADGKLAHSIIDYRYNAGLPTIISTEYSLQEIAAFNEAMAGRIKQRCGDYALHIEKKPGRNYRLK